MNIISFKARIVWSGFLALGFVFFLSGCMSNGRNAPTEEKTKNPYEAYKNGDQGVNGYLFWATIEKTPQVHQFLKRRLDIQKKTDKLLENASLENGGVHLEIESNFFSPDQFRKRTERANIGLQGSGHSSLVYIGEMKDDMPNGFGIILVENNFGILRITNDVAKAAKEGKKSSIFDIEKKMQEQKFKDEDYYYMLYQGYFSEGRYDGYGILYSGYNASVKEYEKEPAVWPLILRYEGMFSKGNFNGEGNLYNDVFRLEEKNSRYDIRKSGFEVFSGEFVDGKKDGNFIYYMVEGEEEPTVRNINFDKGKAVHE